MSIRPTLAASIQPPSALRAAKPPSPPADGQQDLRQAFNQFVGETFFGQMLQAMRKTVGKPAYFHGGRAEQVFTQQLDQVLAEKMSEASAERLGEPMFELFMARRGS